MLAGIYSFSSNASYSAVSGTIVLSSVSQDAMVGSYNVSFGSYGSLSGDFKGGVCHELYAAEDVMFPGSLWTRPNYCTQTTALGSGNAKGAYTSAYAFTVADAFFSTSNANNTYTMGVVLSGALGLCSALEANSTCAPAAPYLTLVRDQNVAFAANQNFAITSVGGNAFAYYESDYLYRDSISAGAVTLTQVSGTNVTGNYNVTFDDSTSLSGTFSAGACSGWIP